MEFVRTAGWSKGTKALSERLVKELKTKQRVLWLVCGGSSIPTAAKVMRAVPEDLSEKLAIFLTDERFGEVGHTDSNAKQLHEAGFHPKNAVFVPVLVPGFSAEETRERYEEAIKRAIDHADSVIALFGIGADGHIAGILPHSPAVDADEWVVIYEAPPYVRATLTFEALKHVDAAYVFVFGDNKRQALTRLRDEKLPLTEQPSQILKELPEAYVYNDQVGGST